MCCVESYLLLGGFGSKFLSYKCTYAIQIEHSFYSSWSTALIKDAEKLKVNLVEFSCLCIKRAEKKQVKVIGYGDEEMSMIITRIPSYLAFMSAHN